ncbi:hypothetical protein [uncultured Roseivirga sp.]|uniref:hypothetical protein n=1 Tax=uncultured Roseivirga sp. TaxID=543088 RepID=UPI0030DADFAE|tara:strand:- start:1706 stop:2500 length:795 start_codon:yes stop_codon:yes gene_type:complete
MRILIISLSILVSLNAIAQDKLDKILMTNGETKTGNVVGISDASIEFVHEGESLKYSLKKENISKIEFASGRIEVFNKTDQTDGEASLADHHNKVAILPFVYIRDGEQKKNDAFERKVQQEFLTLMSGHVGILNIQSTNETNAILAKGGINDENFIQFTMPELANVLGVEYVVQSTLEINQKGSTSYNSGVTNAKQNNAKDKLSIFSSSSSSTQLQFETNVNMSLYNDNGDLVWTQKKQSFWPNEDAYLQTLKFLLKRMPIYTK